MSKLHIARRAVLVCAVAVVLPGVAQAQPWVSFDSHARYVALGDSITAGYGAMPATQGYPYQLYQSGVIDNINNTLLCNMSVPGAFTKDVLDHQVPQVSRFLHDTGVSYKQVITLQIGANDLFEVLNGGNPFVILNEIGTNIFQILNALTTQFPNARIFVANYYDPRLPVPGERDLILAMNQVIANSAALFGERVVLVDIFSAFEGRNGLLLIQKHGASQFEAHPTNAGQRVIADTFAAAMKQK